MAPPFLVPVPTFDQTRPPPSLPTETGQDVLTASPKLGAAGDFSPLSDVSGTGPEQATPTADSSVGTTPPTAAEARRHTGRLIGVVVVIVAGVAAKLLWRTGRALREPSKEQVKDFADPLAAIAVRHFDVTRLNADLADAAAAAGAASEWALDGPIAPRVFGPVDQIGMEHIPQNAPTTPAAPAAGDVWHHATTEPAASRPTVTYQE